VTLNTGFNTPLHSAKTISSLKIKVQGCIRAGHSRFHLPAVTFNCHGSPAPFHPPSVSQDTISHVYTPACTPRCPAWPRLPKGAQKGRRRDCRSPMCISLHTCMCYNPSEPSNHLNPLPSSWLHPLMCSPPLTQQQAVTECRLLKHAACASMRHQPQKLHTFPQPHSHPQAYPHSPFNTHTPASVFRKHTRCPIPCPAADAKMAPSLLPPPATPAASVHHSSQTQFWKGRTKRHAHPANVRHPQNLPSTATRPAKHTTGLLHTSLV
jgi:hypothetical protein